MSLIESTLHPEAAAFRHVIPAGEPYLFEVKAGQTLRLLDLEGNQAVDTLFFSARNPRERYDPQRTLRKQNSVYLTTGTVLWSNLGNPLLTITADTCGRHDTLGGACAQESNTVRYALDKRYMHSCRDNFLRGALHEILPGRPSLACDLVEEWRPFAERLVLGLVNRKAIRPEDFITRSGSELAGGKLPVEMKPNAARALIAAYQRQLEDRLTNPADGRQTAVRWIIHGQCRHFAEALKTGEVYVPFQAPR